MIADADLDFCYLTTVGRTTGRAHRIEIWFAVAPGTDTVYLLAGGREGADWVQNLVAQPECSVDVAASTHHGRARVLAPGTDEDELARTLVHDKYAQGDELQSWRAAALPVAIDLRTRPS